MSTSYQLKLLSGTLNGVEYSLTEGDTIFYVGSHRDLVEGKAAQMLGSVENAFYLPEDLPEAAFVIHIATGTEPLRLGERDGPGEPWQYRAILPQQVLCAAGVHFAIRADDEDWAEQVRAFAPPVALTVVPAAPGAGSSSLPIVAGYSRRVRVGLMLGALALAASLVVGWFWQQAPQAQVRGLTSVLSEAPDDYQILPGRDGKLYAFTDVHDGLAWGERASRRQGRAKDVYLLRSVEAARLELELIDAGLPVVVVRLDQPARPQVVLLGNIDERLQKQVGALLATAAPYAARPAQITGITSAELVALARAELHGLGISTRVEPQGQRVSVINDVFLDDASLNAMATMATAFHKHWGRRRITIQLQLWDDLLQGRSYRYSPGQLLSVGDGRWKYAHSGKK